MLDSALQLRYHDHLPATSELSLEISVFKSSASPGIDGEFLVIPDKTALPQRCVRTNLPVAENEYRTWDIPCMPLWLRIVMILSPVFLLFAPCVVRRCRMKAGLTRTVQHSYLLRRLLACVLILASMTMPFVYAATNLPHLMYPAVAVFPFLFWGGFVLLIMYSSPLMVTDYRDGKFWIKGCSPEFLKSLNESLGNVPAKPIAPHG